MDVHDTVHLYNSCMLCNNVASQPKQANELLLTAYCVERWLLHGGAEASLVKTCILLSMFAISQHVA